MSVKEEVHDICGSNGDIMKNLFKILSKRGRVGGTERVLPKSQEINLDSRVLSLLTRKLV